MTASRTESQDVFDSVCSGGQILGIVNEIQVKAYSLTKELNTTNGTIWSSTVELPANRAADVARVLERMEMTCNMAMYMVIEKRPPVFSFSLFFLRL